MSYQTFTANQLLTSTQMNNLQASVYTQPITTQSGSSYTLQLADKGSTIEFTNFGQVSITVPLMSSVTFPVGTNIKIVNAGTGSLDFIAPGGLTINSEGGVLSLGSQWAQAILTKRTGDNWILRTLSSSVIADGTIVDADISATADIELSKLADATIDEKAASYSLVLTDRNKFIKMNIASTANTVTVPTNASVAFPIGSQIHIIQYGSGKTQVIPVSGTVTLYSTPGTYLRAQYSSATLLKCDTNIWMLIGDLSAS